MQLKILNKQENLLLSRTEVSAELTFNGPTPSTNEVKNELSKQISANVKFINVKKISTMFGHQKAKAELHVYKDEKSMKVAIKKGKKALEKEKKALEEAAKKVEETAAKKAEKTKTEEAPKEEKAE